VKAEEIPFTIVAKVLVVVLRVLEFTKLVLVVAMTPFTFVVKMKLLVVVAMLSVLVVAMVEVANTTSPLISTVKNLVVPVAALDKEVSLSNLSPEAFVVDA
jgi:hypothetical protein